MKKLVAVFVLAVLIPSLILGWLAFRSLHDQELVVERQRALLHQAATDALAADANIFMDDIRLYFRNVVDELVAERGVDNASREFDKVIRQKWGQVEVGAVVSEEGALLSPELNSVEPRVQAFNRFNGDFLSNNAIAEVYQVGRANTNDIAVAFEDAQVLDPLSALESGNSRAVKALAAPAAPGASVYKENVSVLKGKLTSRLAENRQEYADANAPAAADLKVRSIEPQQQAVQQLLMEVDELGQADDEEAPSNWSMLVTQRGEFRELMGEDEEGAFSRFLQNRLHVLLWYRPVNLGGRVFCAQLDLGLLKEEIGKIVSEYRPYRSSSWGRGPEVCMALIDETGAAVSRNIPDFTANWRRPFVASEVGEILPHWEVAAYLVNPGSLNRAASSFRFALGLMIFVLIAAIGFGSLLIFLDLARQTKLARQKTDFVSNVSHELKTPLTSIRMFSDLLSADGEVVEEKRGEYAGIISSEAARLTRLINNLLDFSRLERGDKKYDMKRLDLGELVKETLDHYREHLVSNGFQIEFEVENGFGIEVEGDRDAIAQVLLNLVSNAEKYGGEAKEIAVEIVPVEGKAEVRVMDRGSGVNRKNQERIFKKFYRVDDSLASGIQGSGLGLSLARQIARAHWGDVVYRNREGGGSCFVLVLPMVG